MMKGGLAGRVSSLDNQPASGVNSSQTVARNSFWYGLELLFGVVGAFFTSVVVANVIGPERLATFSYVFWLTNITTAAGSFGMPVTIKKYMAEYLSRGEPDVAHAIYNAALKVQLAIAAAITVAALVLVLGWGDKGSRVISVLLVMSIAPRMIGLVASNANNAAEALRRNTVPSLIGAAFNIVFTLFSLWVGWGLVGVATGYAGGATLEAVLKLIGVRKMLSPIPVGKISPELKKRMYAYSGQGLALLVLNMVVWDKSDIAVLRFMNHDPRQITFFSIAFNISERLLMIPTAFGGSLNVTIMAQYGRGEERLRNLTITGAKYAFLLAVPLLVGVASISGPLVSLLYNEKYQAMIPVLEIAAGLAISKAMMYPPSALLQATENQGFLIWVGCVCGALDIGLDFLLTPAHGAAGAALANGLAQTAATIAIWMRVRHVFHTDLRLAEFGRIALSGAAMAAVVVPVGRLIPGHAGLAAAILCGALVWCGMLRITGALDKADRERFGHLSRTLPGSMQPLFTRLVGWLAA